MSNADIKKCNCCTISKKVVQKWCIFAQKKCNQCQSDGAILAQFYDIMPQWIAQKWCKKQK